MLIASQQLHLRSPRRLVRSRQVHVRLDALELNLHPGTDSTTNHVMHSHVRKTHDTALPEVIFFITQGLKFTHPMQSLSLSQSLSLGHANI